MNRGLLTLLAVLGVCAVAAVPALGAPPASGAAIRATLPEPGEKIVPRTAHFAGQDRAKARNIAVVRGARGAVLVYVCDGASLGSWLTGRLADGVAELSGRKGATATVRFRGGRAVGTAEVGSATIRFSIPRALGPAGLWRVTARAGGRTYEAAWIVTNAGVTRGLASEGGGKTVATSSSTNDPTGPDAGVSPSEGSGTAPPEPTILTRFRCNRLVLASSRVRFEREQGGSVAEATAALAEIGKKFDALGCESFTNF